MIGKNLSNLFPKFLWNSNKTLFLNFLNGKQNDFTLNSSDNYFVDKNNDIFKALQCLRIVAK